MRQFLSIVILIAAFTSCSTIPSSKCKSIDWEKIGQVDASIGRLADFQNEHRDSCDENFNSEKYTQGRKAGLAEFCTKDTAFYLGKRGVQKTNQCIDNQKEFNEHYNIGSKVYKLKSDLRGLETKIDEEEKRIQSEELSKSSRRVLLEGIFGVNTTNTQYFNRLSGQQGAIEKAVEELESNYITPEQFQYGTTISTGLGAYLGSFAGFGIGHPLQGRYIDRGWIFTIGEIGSFFLPGVGPVLGFLSFKIWEIRDLWNNSYQEGLGYRRFEIK